MANVTISSPPIQEPAGSQRWLEWFNTIDGILSQLAGLQNDQFINAASINYTGDNTFSGTNTVTGTFDFSGGTLILPSPITEDLEFSGNITFSNRIVLEDNSPGIVFENRSAFTSRSVTIWNNLNSSAGPPAAATGNPALIVLTSSASSNQKSVMAIAGPDGGNLQFGSTNNAGTTFTAGPTLQWDDSTFSFSLNTPAAFTSAQIRLQSGGTLSRMELNDTDDNCMIGAFRSPANSVPDAGLVLENIARGLRLNEVNNTNEAGMTGINREGMLWYNTSIDQLKFFDGAGVAQTVLSGAASAAYTPTNVTTDRSYDANNTTINELADVVGTMIADLQTAGVFG